MIDREATMAVDVEFDQQQDALLQKIRKAGTHGTSDEEVIRNVFREFLRQHGMLTARADETRSAARRSRP